MSDVHTAIWKQFDDVVSGNSDGPALICRDGRVVTFGELAATAAGVAASWAASGRPVAGRIVADASGRGPDQIVNYLAAQCAGACYCALDPRRPETFRQRAVQMLAPSVLVGDGGTEFRPDGSVLPADAATILFTSGTTGTPRAILQTGEQIRWFANNAGLAPLTGSDRVAHCSSAGFDTYLFEVVRTLLNAATVVVLPRFEDCFTDGIEGVLKRSGVTVMLAPATLVNSTAQMSPGAFNSLRILYSGGSELYSRSVFSVFDAGYRSSLVNLYGPAEGVVACTGHELDPAAPDDGPVVPLGRALPGMTLTVVPERPGDDPRTGRLVISGDGISAGYLAPAADGTLTCTPFEPDGRTFRTGDVVTRDDTGTLGFVRRTGGLLKVNGVRTSRAELEAGAYAAGATAASVVEHDGEPVLVVQLPPGGDAAGFVGALRRTASVLPRVRVVASIPVTVNGKYDASGLLDAPEQARAPARADDEVLARLVAQVEEIHGRPVPPRCDLYDLGFSSLQFAMLLLAITERDDVELSAEELLSTPDLDELAELLAERGMQLVGR